METPESGARREAPREIEIVRPDSCILHIRERTTRERIGDALILAGLIAVSCGLWLFSLLWLYSVRHVVLGLF